MFLELSTDYVTREGKNSNFLFALREEFVELLEQKKNTDRYDWLSHILRFRVFLPIILDSKILR